MTILAPAGISEPNRPESLDFVQVCSEAGCAAKDAAQAEC
jgi:hypothetical protein